MRLANIGDRGGTVDKVLYYRSEGRWFDPRCSKHRGHTECVQNLKKVNLIATALHVKILIDLTEIEWIKLAW
jgi:hypothetical protein